MFGNINAINLTLNDNNLWENTREYKPCSCKLYGGFTAVIWFQILSEKCAKWSYSSTAGALLHCLQELTHLVSLWYLLCVCKEKIAFAHAVKQSKPLCDIGCVAGLSPMGTVEHLLDTVCYNNSSHAQVGKCFQMLCWTIHCVVLESSTAQMLPLYLIHSWLQ